MKKVIAALLLASLVATPASAATKKPTPKPTVKATVKATAKATARTSAKPNAKASTKASAASSTKTTSTAKATPAPTKKKVVVKRKPRKKVRVTPSPKADWPPAGFSQSGEVYAKVPTSKELLGLISAKTSLANAVKACTDVVCGAVQVGAETGCTWWEVVSKVLGRDNTLLGTLTTLSSASAAQEIKTILLISDESLDTNGRMSGISVTCHHEEKDPSITSGYKKAG
jgi:hypothetical protein